MSKSFEYTLVTPITVDGKSVTTLSLPPLKAKFARKMRMHADGTMDMDTLLTVAEMALAEKEGKIIAQLTIDELDGEDMLAVVGHVGEWLGSSQKTG